MLYTFNFCGYDMAKYRTEDTLISCSDNKYQYATSYAKEK